MNFPPGPPIKERAGLEKATSLHFVEISDLLRQTQQRFGNLPIACLPDWWCWC